MRAVIPLRLRISGFLSYRDPAELDFTSFDLACISGPNGAGKSTLLDAITWALFGQARRRDEALINLQSETAEVVLDFSYEEEEYRVIRSLRRGKGGLLELQIRHPAEAAGEESKQEDSWKPLTERTQRETQVRIQEVLGLDYETFVNAAFFLQGKADLFAQQSPARRKEVLGNILGLEIWEAYKTRSAEMRREQEAQLAAITGRMSEMQAEIAEEPERRRRLEELEAELARLQAAVTAQAATLDGVRKTHAVIERQRALLAEHVAGLESVRSNLKIIEERLADRRRAQRESLDLTVRGKNIEAAYTRWQASVSSLRRWDEIARAFSDGERGRLPFLEAIAAEQARLEQERSHLFAEQDAIRSKEQTAANLGTELKAAKELLADLERRAGERNELDRELTTAREEAAQKLAENGNLREKMEDLKSRIETLNRAEGGACPLCGQPLDETHKASSLEKLQTQGTGLGNQYRANNDEMKELQDRRAALETRMTALAEPEKQVIIQAREVAQRTERLAGLQAEVRSWNNQGRKRLDELSQILQHGDFAPDARGKLKNLDAELGELGYDAAEHDALRRAEAELRPAQEDFQQLQTARAALAPLQDEVRNLEQQAAARKEESLNKESEMKKAQRELDAASADLPDIAGVERALFDLQEQSNRANQEVGAARQRVSVLADLRIRSKESSVARQSLATAIGRHKMLESAFGKDGVPALLIEEALPDIEARANGILDRLSDSGMSIHFETQAAYRDKKRGDLRETLNIMISDGAGKRDYEMYSGGEAFRVNFAIRLALSEVLAGRKGARLQTLVIDEGFGSQDNQGRQRLIEVINLVRPDFAKILLISHLDELKEAFPTRIEVEKAERGSSIRVR